MSKELEALCLDYLRRDYELQQMEERIKDLTRKEAK